MIISDYPLITLYLGVSLILAGIIPPALPPLIAIGFVIVLVALIAMQVHFREEDRRG